MKKLFTWIDRITSAFIAVCLAVMAILVFTNVVLRYAFDSGLTWSEEVARFLFIWMTFLGAVGALSDNNHLGVDMLVKKLPLQAKRAAFLVSNAIVLYILWLILDGSWKITVSSIGSTAPATGLSLAFIYVVGIIMSVCMGLIVMANMYRVLFDPQAVIELTTMKESEEEIMNDMHEAEHLQAGGGRS